MRWLARLVDLVYAPTCAACDRLTPAGVGLCPACAISLVPCEPGCPRCACPGPSGVACRRCREAEPPFESIAAPFLYGGELAVALRRLKFSGRRDVARTLAPLIGPPLARAAAGCDLVVPVPLHRRRMARRGFNQAALLVRHALPGRPVDALSLRRVRATLPQTGLDARARQSNVAGAFAVLPSRRARVTGRRVLLVDDILTTGATMAAAASALVAAGAHAVVGFCAARADS